VQSRYLQHIGIYWSENWDEGIFVRLETHLKRVILENVEVNNNNYDTVKNMLDPMKGPFYLLIYSFYETGVIGLQRSDSAVEKILFNIVAHTCLMAHVNNDNVKKALQSKSEIPKFVQNDFSQSNFRYTDFTKVLQGGNLPKKDMFLINADKLKKETNDNIQLIIDQEFGDNPGYKRLCEDYNSKVVEFNKNILFERFPFKIGHYAIHNYLKENVDFDSFIYANGYPKNILSRLMDENTKSQIVNFTDIRLKSIFILIFISKVCLCNVTDLCTLPEYLILIGSLQKAYLEYKKTKIASDDFQSLLSYFFSLDYLDKDCGSFANDRERARSIIISAIFPEYNVIFPDFDSEIDKFFGLPFSF